MVEMKIKMSELKVEGDETIQKLGDFIKEKTNADISTITEEILVKSEEGKISRSYLRVLIRKYLHKVGLKEYYRVIGGKDNVLVIKQRKAAEEEE